VANRELAAHTELAGAVDVPTESKQRAAGSRTGNLGWSGWNEPAQGQRAAVCVSGHCEPDWNFAESAALPTMADYNETTNPVLTGCMARVATRDICLKAI